MKIPRNDTKAVTKAVGRTDRIFYRRLTGLEKREKFAGEDRNYSAEKARREISVQTDIPDNAADFLHNYAPLEQCVDRQANTVNRIKLITSVGLLSPRADSRESSVQCQPSSMLEVLPYDSLSTRTDGFQVGISFQNEHLCVTDFHLIKLVHMINLLKIGRSRCRRPTRIRRCGGRRRLICTTTVKTMIITTLGTGATVLIVPLAAADAMFKYSLVEDGDAGRSLETCFDDSSTNNDA
uniref:Uncharacterized protein n=1 Tax=Romanomermis culicivorax TaxID=13658 RepID=A0A915IZC1_ROMCU